MTLNIIHNETIETAILSGRVRLLQPRKGFHASLDTVFLAAATQVKAGDALLDIGCGVGSAGLCVLARQPGVTLTGLDVQENLVNLARENAGLNGVADACRFITGNLLDNPPEVANNAFDAVMMNPPYQSHGTPSPNDIKRAAHGEYETGASLTDWVKYAHAKLRNGSTLSLIHRADRLDEILVALTSRRWFGSVTVIPLWPRAGDPSKRVIVTARKERYAPLRLLQGVVLHKTDGSYTPEAEGILLNARAIY